MFSSEQWLANSGADFYNGVATQSLRLDHGSSAYLYRTPSDTGNRRKFTWSGWVKINSQPSGKNIVFLGAGNSSTNSSIFYFDGSNQNLRWYHLTGGGSQVGKSYAGKLRDNSSWYHIVFAVDTGVADSGDTYADSNRVRIYLNGTELRTTDANFGVIGQNSDLLHVNTNIQHQIGHYVGTTSYSDIYLAEVNFVNDAQLTPSSFGETKNGVWIPITPNVTYGATGFRLQFTSTAHDAPASENSADTDNIGADSSGQNNHWTASDSIVASDCAMPDSPENNFCTMNPLHFRATYGMATLSEGNLAYGSTGLSSSWGAQFSTFNLNSGKWYAEVLTKGNLSCSIGVMNVGHYGYQHFLVQNPQNETGNWTLFMDETDTKSRLNGSLADPTYTAFSNDQVLGIALNADDKELSFYVDGTLQTGLGSSGVIDISTGGSSNDAWSFTANTANGLALTFVWNFGQDSSFAGDETATSNADANGNGTFHSAVPSGYLALCTANLEEPTIGANSDTQASDHFNTLIYSGNNNATRTFDIGFVSDWSWFKARNQAGYGHQLYDSSRGVQKYLRSNGSGTDTVAGDVANSEGVLDFDDSGTLLKIGTDAFLNEDGTTMVIWNWKANGGTTTTNDASSTGIGTIDSVFQANTTAGFSIVTYTGTGSNATVGHGLDNAPEVLLVKSRETSTFWMVYHIGLGANTSYMSLNTTLAVDTGGASVWNSTTPTDSVFSIGTSSFVNPSSDMVAYCFHSVDGYSKMGSYTGNADHGDGPFVFLGFKPAWIMIKSASATSAFTSWAIYDNVRKTFNDDVGTNSKPLFANKGAAEGTRGNDSSTTTGNATALDFLSNGFKPRVHSDEINQGNTYIYMAFAEQPFKYANAE